MNKKFWQKQPNDLLGKISIQGFEPKTAQAGEEVDRKIELRDYIQEKIDNLSEIQEAYRNIEKFSINVKFYLWGGSKVEGRTKKDLDNLLKIVCDVLADYMDSEKKNPGLGIMRTDNAIHEIHCSKYIVDEKDEGIDIEISECKK